MQANDPPKRLGFGVFEVDLRERQLTKRGLRIRLQEQPFQVLAMLLERPGDLVRGCRRTVFQRRGAGI